MSIFNVDRIQTFFRQEYMRSKENKEIGANDIAVHAVAEILGKTDEQVKPEEAALIRFLYYNSTMTFDKPRMNNLTDNDFRERVKNMHQYLDAGFSLDHAMEHSGVPLKQESVPVFNVDNKRSEKTDRFGEFKKKYPLLFNDKGELRPEAIDVLDMLLEQHVPQLVKKDKKEASQAIRN